MPPAARARIALVSSGDSPDSSAYPATVAMVHTTPTAVQTPMMYARERPSSRIAAALARLSGTLPRKTTASSTSPRPGALGVEADPDRDALRHAVQHGADQQRGAGDSGDLSALLLGLRAGHHVGGVAARRLRGDRGHPLQPHVGHDVDDGVEEEPADRVGGAAGVERLAHQLERQGRHQDARPEGDDPRHHPSRRRREQPEEHPHHEARARQRPVQQPRALSGIVPLRRSGVGAPSAIVPAGRARSGVARRRGPARPGAEGPRSSPRAGPPATARSPASPGPAVPVSGARRRPRAAR